MKHEMTLDEMGRANGETERAYVRGNRPVNRAGVWAVAPSGRRAWTLHGWHMRCTLKYEKI